ncbi:diguanylate cyclase [Paenibacillus sp. FSL K6-2441]
MKIIWRDGDGGKFHVGFPKNRRAFMHHTRETLRQCWKEGIPASFILIDVDHCKTINDSFGHHIGNELLQEFAGKVHPRLREGDLFGA